MMASHFRRLHMARTVSRPDPFRVSSVIPRSSSPLLRHQDDVAGLQVKIRLIRLAGDHLVVVEGNPCDRRIVVLRPSGTTVRCRDANCVKPPARARTSSTVVAALSSYRAGL